MIARFLVALVVITLLIWHSANAVELKLTGGITHYVAAPCGNWYQCTPVTPYTLRLNALAGSVGLYSDPANGWQLGVGVGNAGRVTSDAVVCDVDGPCPKWSLSHMQGQGTDPYGFIDVQKHWGNAFASITLYDSRMSYENTNYNWHNVNDQSAPTVVSHVDHLVKSTFGLGLGVGYSFGPLAVVGKLIPTAANNQQYDPVAKENTWYRPVQSSAIGYSPFLGVEYTF